MEKYCEFCGEVLLDNGRCPDADCVYNLYLDVCERAEKLDAEDAARKKAEEEAKRAEAYHG